MQRIFSFARIKWTIVAVAVFGGCTERPSPVGPRADSCDTRVQLVRGAGRSLTSSETACFQLDASSSYALAYFDATSVERARNGPELLMADESGFSITLSSGDNSGASARLNKLVSDGAFEALDHIRAAQSASADCSAPIPVPLCRTMPWTPGESIVYPLQSGSLTATVFAVVGHLVLAGVDTDQHHFTGPVKAEYVAAAQHILDNLVPLAKTAFSEKTPVTSDGSGQLLVLIGSQFATLVVLSPSGGNSYGWVELGLVLTTAPRLSVPLAHELVHAWQGQFEAERGWTGPGGRGWPVWSSEGNADFIAREALRKAAGVEVGANPDRAVLAASADRWASAYAESIREGSAALGPWFGSAGGGTVLQRDWVFRAVSNGAPYDVALRETSRGMLEGWFGVNDSNFRSTGLTARMKVLFSDAWDPVEAFPSAVLSYALDDRAPGEIFHTSLARNSWLHWREDATLNLAVPGASAVISTPLGASAGWVRVTTGPSGGSLRIATDKPGVRFMIARM